MSHRKHILSYSHHSLSQTLSSLSVKLYPFSPSNSTHSFTEALFLSFSYTHTFNKLFLCFHTSPIQNGSRHVFPLSPFPLSRARSPLIFCGTHFNANSTAASIPGFKFKKWNYEKGGERGILKSSFWAVEKTISEFGFFLSRSFGCENISGKNNYLFSPFCEDHRHRQLLT